MLNDIALPGTDDATIGLNPLGHAASFRSSPILFLWLATPGAFPRHANMHHPAAGARWRAAATLPFPASYKWHATRWPGETSCSRGSTLEQRGIASGQRVWKRQP